MAHCQDMDTDFRAREVDEDASPQLGVDEHRRGDDDEDEEEEEGEYEEGDREEGALAGPRGLGISDQPSWGGGVGWSNPVCPPPSGAAPNFLRTSEHPKCIVRPRRVLPRGLAPPSDSDPDDSG